MLNAEPWLWYTDRVCYIPSGLVRYRLTHLYPAKLSQRDCCLIILTRCHQLLHHVWSTSALKSESSRLSNLHSSQHTSREAEDNGEGRVAGEGGFSSNGETFFFFFFFWMLGLFCSVIVTHWAVWLQSEWINVMALWCEVKLLSELHIICLS